MSPRRYYLQALSALIAGIALAVSSFLVPHDSLEWSQKQAENYSEAAANLYRLTYEAALAKESANSQAPLADGKKSDGQKKASEKHLLMPADMMTPPDLKTATPERAVAALADAKVQYQQARSALENAQARHRGPMPILLWPGLALIAVGAWYALKIRSQTASKPV